jgi:glutathione S-transferase
MGYKLILGNKNYSSWSMRAWLLLRLVEVPFEEVNISLYRLGAREQVRKFCAADVMFAPVASRFQTMDRSIGTEGFARRGRSNQRGAARHITGALDAGASRRCHSGRGADISGCQSGREHSSPQARRARD